MAPGTPFRSVLRGAAWAVAAFALAGVVAGGWFYRRVRASLPQLDGRARLAGLAAPVRVDRDALGVPTLFGTNRADVARATGYLHAQDRFFQMDVMRRRAAGELAELFGAAALPLDREVRRNGFRALARQVAAAMTPAERTVVTAYTGGVNAGLAALKEKPFEYLVLRSEPRPWRPEDCALVAYAITLDLQDDSDRYEKTLAALRDNLGPRSLAFFAPEESAADAALDGSTGRKAPIPSAREIDLRRAPAGGSNARAPSAGLARAGEGNGRGTDAESPGSNAFALDGAHAAAGGAALLANDMHLRLGVPPTWYRASLQWPGHRLAGVTLPGLPLIIAGSNGRVAWGFTNAYVDTADLVVIDPGPSPDYYHTPGSTDLQPIEVRHEWIAVRGRKPVAVDYRWTKWGPIIGETPAGRPLALRWTEHDPAATNFGLLGLEEAGTVAEAVALAHRAGMPALNFLAADSAGAIAWTIAGRVPRRIGYAGRVPVSWSFGDRRWDGYVPPDEVPTILSPRDGRLWTANNRPLGGGAGALLGDGGYVGGARAAQVRDDLDDLIRAGRRATPGDFLAIQLDDRARFLERWRTLLLEVLSPRVVAAKASRAALRAAVERWEGRAGVDSASYRLVRAFRLAAAQRILDPIFAPCVAADPSFDWSRLRYEEPLWTLIAERPAHLLNPAFASWEDVLVAAADDVSAALEREGLRPAEATWGKFNRTAIVHPFAQRWPHWLAGLLSLPSESLPGDRDMPRVQAPSFGASERFAVAPGRESEGIFELAGGQSGHPLSPFFRAGFEAWAHGEPAPFLPGPAVHSLALEP